MVLQYFEKKRTLWRIYFFREFRSILVDLKRKIELKIASPQTKLIKINQKKDLNPFSAVITLKAHV